MTGRFQFERGESGFFQLRSQAREENEGISTPLRSKRKGEIFAGVCYLELAKLAANYVASSCRLMITR
jgi:hypothetical protein